VLLDQPEIEAVKALYCSGCREYFAFEENAVHIHRQSARHLKGTHTSAGNSSEWNELQVAQNDEPSPASIGAPNTTQSSRNDLESVPAECAVTSSPVKRIPNASSELAAPNSACESTTPSATTESAASVATVSSTSPFAPVITNTFSLANLSGDPSTENVASSDIQCHVADTNPAPTSTTQVPALVPIVLPPTNISQKSNEMNSAPNVEMNSTPEVENPAPHPSNSKSVSVASQTEEPPLLDGKAVVANPTMPTTSDTSIPATVSTLPGSATGTDVQTTKPSALSKFDINNFIADPYEQLMKEGQMLKHIVRRIRAGVKVMVVLRGIPGSGKSHLANRLEGQGIIVSYDDFLTDLDGKYNWNEESAVRAASMALKEVQAAANSGQQLIIVDGHNLMPIDMSHYQKVAKT
jgi:hypothetical protein